MLCKCQVLYSALVRTTSGSPILILIHFKSEFIFVLPAPDTGDHHSHTSDLIINWLIHWIDIYPHLAHYSSILCDVSYYRVVLQFCLGQLSRAVPCMCACAFIFQCKDVFISLELEGHIFLWNMGTACWMKQRFVREELNPQGLVK